MLIHTWEQRVITGGPSSEGGKGERILSLYSDDDGATWSNPTQLEPNTSLTNAYATITMNKNGRIYAMYNFNLKNISTLPNGDSLSRNDELGYFVFKYSDNGGITWSDNRFIIPYNNTFIDYHNSWNGSVDIMWCVDQTKYDYNYNLYYAFTKIENYPQNPPESIWVVSSNNIWDEMNVSNVKWDMYPNNGLGITGINNSDTHVAEEPHILVLSTGFAVVFRTDLGYLGCSYSKNEDSLKYKWTESNYCKYYNYNSNSSGRRSNKSNRGNVKGEEISGDYSYSYNYSYSYSYRYVKNPRGPITPKQVLANSNLMNETRYIMLYNNNGGTSYEYRNPLWLVSGKEYFDNILNITEIVWSQPEIILYNSKTQNNERFGYCDIIQFYNLNSKELNIYFTETNKTVARLHKISQNLLKYLVNQFDLSINPADFNVSLIFSNVNGSNTIANNNTQNLIPSFNTSSTAQTPPENLGFSIFLLLSKHNNSKAGDIILEYTNQDVGMKLIVANNDLQIEIQLFDVKGNNFTFTTDMDCTNYLVGDGYAMHGFGIVVDGNARIVTMFVDGYLCDGDGDGDSTGNQLFGWSWLPDSLGNLNNGQTKLNVGLTYHGEIVKGYWFQRQLLTSHMVAFYRNLIIV